jgi:hypothetical protein
VEVTLFAFATAFSKGLKTASHILEKGAEHARATGVSEAEMLDWRLAPDMFPLSRQLQIAISFAQQWPARAAGLEPAPTLEGPTSVAELREQAAAAIEFLATLKPEQFEGRDAVPLTISLGQMEPTLPIGQWMTGFAATNFYFHLSIAYAILRSRGAPLGKIDLFAGGL